MPVYQYRDERSGVIVELCRRVAERDCVAAGLRRITVPERLTVFGTSSDRLEPGSAVEAVPRALKALGNNQVNDMVKESGFSVDKFKEVWGV